jgi:hypothetical protein
MIEGRPRQSLILYDPPSEIAAGGYDPMGKSFGGKSIISMRKEF